MHALLQRLWGPVWHGRTAESASTRLFRSYVRCTALGGATCFATRRREVRRLVARVDLSRSLVVVDPFCGSNTIATELRSALGLDVVANDIRSECGTTHCDAASPPYYAALGDTVDAIVTSPPFELLDLVLHQIVRAARKVACVHAPIGYMEGTDARWRFFKRLHRESRLYVSAAMCNARQRYCVWLVIFASSALRTEMLLR